MFLFPEPPDPIFLAIFREALEYVREVQLVQFREGHRPTRSERKELDECYATLYPELVPFFSRGRLIRVIDRLLAAGPGPEPALAGGAPPAVVSPGPTAVHDPPA